MANSKNIRSRKRIREALPIMPNRFHTYAMSAATGLSARRVHGLLKGMNEVMLIRVGPREIVWKLV